MASKERVVSKLVIPEMHSQLQYDYFRSLAPITAACFGTKWGKTFSTAAWFCGRMWSMQTGESMPHWWVAPIYKQSRIAIRLIKNMLPADRIQHVQTENIIRLFNKDGSIRSVGEFRSAKNPNDLQGEGIATGVFDEADRASEESWNSFQTTATITQAPLKVISSPIRRGWFFDLHRRGTSKFITPEQRARLIAGDYTASIDGVVSFNGPTSDNPFVSQHVIEKARKNLPLRAFRAYYEAQFPDSGGVVFGDIDGCFLDLLEESQPRLEETYVVCSDLGKHQDFTVVDVISVQRRQVVWRTKWKDLSWNETARRIVELAEIYNYADIIIDATGLGDPVFDNLAEICQTCHIEGYKFTNASKKALVENLILGFDKKDIKIPKQYEELREELEYFGFEITESGNIRYEAETGHDDEVFTLALGYWWITNMITPGIRMLNTRAPGQVPPPTSAEETERIKKFLVVEQKKFEQGLKQEYNRRFAKALGDPQDEDYEDYDEE